MDVLIASLERKDDTCWVSMFAAAVLNRAADSLCPPARLMTPDEIEAFDILEGHAFLLESV